MHTIGGHGTSLKGTDYGALPGCNNAHQELPENSEAFEKKWGVSVEEVNIEALTNYLLDIYGWQWWRKDLKALMEYVEEVEAPK